jgi:hypothetical protein
MLTEVKHLTDCALRLNEYNSEILTAGKNDNAFPGKTWTLNALRWLSMTGLRQYRSAEGWIADCVSPIIVTQHF